MLVRASNNPFDAPIKHNLGQRIGQVALEAVTSVAPIAFFGQFMTPSQDAFGYMVSFVSGPMNYIAGKFVGTLINKQNPFSELQASGMGNPCRGFLVEGGKTVLTTAAALGAGYGVARLIMTYSGDALKSTNPVVQGISVVLQDSALLNPILGLVGFGAYRIGMKLWDVAVPIKDESVGDRTPLYLVQTLGQYVMRFGGDFILTETALFYLRHYGQQTLAADFRLQAGAFLLIDVSIMKLAAHFVSTIHPISSLVDPIELARTKAASSTALLLEDELSDDLEALAIAPKPIPTVGCLTAKAIAGKVGAYTLFCGSAYGSALLICYLSPTCAIETIADQAKNLALAVGIPLGADFVVKEVYPRMKSWCGFWQRPTLTLDVAQAPQPESLDEIIRKYEHPKQ